MNFIDDWHDPPQGCDEQVSNAAAAMSIDGFSQIECSCCHRDFLKVYWRERVKEQTSAGIVNRRGSGWIWCSSCRSFQHWVGVVPVWWPELDPLQGVSLQQSPVGMDEQWEVIENALTPSPK